MALVLQDRVKETSSSSGTGNITLGGAIPGFRTFVSCIPTASIVYYCIHNLSAGYDTEWEVGYGTFTSPDTLVRTNVYSSSNAGALVNFTAGVNGLEVFITYPSEQAVYQQTTGLTEFNEGPISVVGANATAGTFDATLAQFTSNVDGFSQLYIQNQSTAANASSDIVAYNEISDGSSYFVDMGMSSSTYNDGAYPIFQENDAYLFNAGNVAGTGAAGDISRLLIGTSTANSNVVVFGGSVETNAVIATFVASTKNVNFANNISVTSDVTANNAQFTNFVYSGANLANAANSTVLVTQAYVDNAVAAGLDIHDPVNLTTVAVLSGTPTYNQPGGAGNGVGATLTAAGVGTLSVDGKNAAAGFRILVQSQANAVQNGVYTVTTEGDAGTAYILTRATDSDTSATLSQGSYYYTLDGDTVKGDAFVVNTVGTINFGVTNITFALFSSPTVYTGTSPINVTNTTISLDTVPVANGGTNLTSFTTGDVIYANATNTLTSRAIGSTNAILVSNGSIPNWGTVALGSANAVSGTLGATYGGTGQSTYTLGDTLYANATNTVAKLAGNITTTKKYLQQVGDGVNSAAPSWVQIAGGDISGLGTMATQDANAVAITGGSLNNVTIGASTPNTGAFTTLNAANITASTLFTGNGSAISAINASNISSGTIANARTSGSTSNSASTIVLRDTNGSFGANIISASFSGDGSAISAINASNLSSGTVANARTTAATANGASTIVLRDGSGGFGAGDITAVSISGNGVALTAINASNIASGTIANARTTASASNGAATIVLRGASGEFAAGVITADGSGLSAINASNVSTGTIANARTTAASANGASTIVLRGTSGEFSAGVITADGSGLSAINASNVSTGTIANARTSAASANGASTIVLRDANGSFAGNVGTFTTIAGTLSTAAQTNITSTGNLTNLVATSFGCGTAASGTAGEIRATNNVTAYYSDDRMKINLGNIPDALAKLKTLNGFYYEANDIAQAMGYEVKKEVGVSAQQVQAIMPEVVAPAPINDKYLTVRYERLVPLLIEAIKELEAQVAELKAK
jgi:hypothetical protein